MLPPEARFCVSGSTYSLLGTMARNANTGWRLDSFTAPLNQTFYLKLRAPIGNHSNMGNLEIVRQFHFTAAEGIFADGFE